MQSKFFGDLTISNLALTSSDKAILLGENENSKEI